MHGAFQWTGVTFDVYSHLIVVPVTNQLVKANKVFLFRKSSKGVHSADWLLATKWDEMSLAI